MFNGIIFNTGIVKEIKKHTTLVFFYLYFLNIKIIDIYIIDDNSSNG